jgi:hypothetical protein
MEEELNTTERIKEEALINAGFRKRYIHISSRRLKSYLNIM